MSTAFGANDGLKCRNLFDPILFLFPFWGYLPAIFGIGWDFQIRNYLFLEPNAIFCR